MSPPKTCSSAFKPNIDHKRNTFLLNHAQKSDDEMSPGIKATSAVLIHSMFSSSSSSVTAKTVTNSCPCFPSTGSGCPELSQKLLPCAAFTMKPHDVDTGRKTRCHAAGAAHRHQASFSDRLPGESLLVEVLAGCRAAPVHLDRLCLKIPGATVQVFFTIVYNRAFFF